MTPASYSRRRFLSGLAVGAVGLLGAACSSGAAASPSPSSTAPPPAPTPTLPLPSATPTPEPSTSAPVEPDLRARIGAMLLVGFRGLTVEAASPVARDIVDHRLGGVLLFDRDQPTGTGRNIESPAQLRALVAGLQAVAADVSPGLPLIVAVDEEGGRVARLGPKHGFPPTDSAATLGARGDPAYTEARAATMAETLAAAGINLNLAPVVDLDLNPENPAIGALDRSFSADPDVVVAQARAFIRGHAAHDVRTSLKHFPGQGSATGDTHAGIVDVTHVWTEDELAPFARIVAEGAADAVLTAHVFNATLDPDYPATLSRPTVSGILRDRLGFGGLVISDDMQMGAIREAFGYEEALALAIEAGVDVLTIANQQVFEEGIVERTIEAIAGHVAAGRIDEARIDESWTRIEAFRSRLLAGPTGGA